MTAGFAFLKYLLPFRLMAANVGGCWEPDVIADAPKGRVGAFCQMLRPANQVLEVLLQSGYRRWKLSCQYVSNADVRRWP